jgi:hypothetical protein
MKNRYRIYRRGRVLYCRDLNTGKNESLKTKDRAAAERIVHAKNEAVREPQVNLALARAYLSAIRSTSHQNVRVTHCLHLSHRPFSHSPWTRQSLFRLRFPRPMNLRFLIMTLIRSHQNRQVPRNQSRQSRRNQKMMSVDE